MLVMSPSGGASEYDSDPLGLGATVEYVEVSCLQVTFVDEIPWSVSATWTLRQVSRVALDALVSNPA